MQPPADGDEQKRRHARWFAEAYSAGIAFPAAIVLGLGLGWWVDKRFGTWPWLTIVFGVFGAIAAFINLFKVAARDDGTGK